MPGPEPIPCPLPDGARASDTHGAGWLLCAGPPDEPLVPLGATTHGSLWIGTGSRRIYKAFPAEGTWYRFAFVAAGP